MFRTPEHCLSICAAKYAKGTLLCSWLIWSGATLKFVSLMVSHQHLCPAYLGRADCCILTPGWDVNQVHCRMPTDVGMTEGPLCHFLTQRLITDICFLRNLTLLITPRDVFIAKVHGLQDSVWSVLSWMHVFVFECLMSVRPLTLFKGENTNTTN